MMLGQPVQYAPPREEPSFAASLVITFLPLVLLAVLAVPLFGMLRRTRALQARSQAHMDAVEKRLEGIERHAERQTELLEKLASK